MVLYAKMILSTLFLAAAICAITSFGTASGIVLAAYTAVGTISLYGFFKTYNQISARNIVDTSGLVPATAPG